LSAGLTIFLKRSFNTTKDKSVEVVIVDKNSKDDFKNNAKQIVEQSEKRINDEIDEKAKYLSRYNQRVAEQTKAQNNGKFQNDAKMGEAKKNVANQKVQETPKVTANTPKTKQRALKAYPDGDIPLPKLADLKPQFHWDKVPAGVENPGPQSQTDDFLKDLKTGPQTLLTSREFVYYSYYSRIKERLRLFWEPKIKEKVTRILASGRHIASNEEKITKLIITLDKNGVLIRVQVLGASGLQDLDDAAIEAFQSAAPFPNPPTGIIETDGTIKIRWDFILEANSDLLRVGQDMAVNGN
jgi:protein TonB